MLHVELGMYAHRLAHWVCPGLKVIGLTHVHFDLGCKPTTYELPPGAFSLKGSQG